MNIDISKFLGDGGTPVITTDTSIDLNKFIDASTDPVEMIKMNTNLTSHEKLAEIQNHLVNNFKYERGCELVKRVCIIMLDDKKIIKGDNIRYKYEQLRLKEKENRKK